MRVPGLLCAVALVFLAAPAVAQQAREVYHQNERVEREVGYAQAVRVGNTIHVSGTIGRGATLQEQMETAYRRISASLAHYGADFDDVVRETIYTTDVKALEQAIPVRKAVYGTATPAATWVQVQRLLVAGALLEIEITAVVDDSAH